MKPKEWAECLQTLSSWVGSGDETSIWGHTQYAGVILSIISINNCHIHMHICHVYLHWPCIGIACESVSVVTSNLEYETTDSREMTVLVNSGSSSTEENYASTLSSTTVLLLDWLRATCPSGIMGTTTDVTFDCRDAHVNPSKPIMILAIQHYQFLYWRFLD